TTGQQSLVNHSSTSTTVAATSTLTYRTVSAGSTAYVIFDSANATLFGTAVNGGGVGTAFTDGSTSANDLFAYNLATGQQTLVSHSGTSANIAGTAASTYRATTADGAYVIFSAFDATQFGTTTNGSTGTAFGDGSTSTSSTTLSGDVFAYNLSTGAQVLVTHSGTSATTAGSSITTNYLGVTLDGAYVIFSSVDATQFGTATNAATGSAFTDTNTTNVTDLLAYNLSTGQQSLVSHSNAGTTTAATSAASYASISASNSKFVFFTSSTASAFGFSDSTNAQDLLAYNLSTGEQLLVNHSSANTTTTGALTNAYAGVSRDGSYVMFTEVNASLLGNSGVSFTDGYTALADLLAYNTSNYTQSLISHSGTSTLVSAMATVTYLSVTAQGEYVVFAAKDASLFGTATNTSTGVAFTDNGKGFDDLFAYNTSTGEIKLMTHTGSMSGGLYTTAGYASSVTYKDISADGRYALFETNDARQFGNNGLSLSTNEKTNVFSYEFATGTLRCLAANQDLTTTEAYYSGISADGNYVYMNVYNSDLTRLADHTGTATFTGTSSTPQVMISTRLNVLDLATASDTVTSASGTVYDNITTATSFTLNAVVTANLSVKLYETINGVETAIGGFVTSDAAGLATFTVTGCSIGAHTYFVKDSTGQAITYLAGTTSGQYLTVTVTAGPFMSSLQALLFSADGVQQGAFSTDSQGALKLDSGEVGTRSLLLVLKDSNGDAADYLDEFTGLAVDLRSDLRTVVDADTDASGGALAVNPLSELAVRLCEQHSGAIPSLAQFSAMKTALAGAFGLSELSQTAVAVNSADFASATAGEQDYGRLLGVMSTLDYMFGDMDQALKALTNHATVRYGADGTPAQVTWTEEMQSWIDIAWVGMKAYTAHADNNAQIEGQAALLPALSAQGVLLDAPGTGSTLTATARQTLVMAGDGDDKIQSADGLQTVFGGAGVDSYALTGAGVTLDFSRLYGIEQIDLSGTGNNSVRLTLDMVLKQGGQANWLQSHGWEGLGNTNAQQLVITGDVGDTVQLSGLSTSGKSVAHAGHVYQLYEGTSVSQGYVQLLVDQNLAVSTMVL
uniref:beta strand repeat-containing protein n=1 Tax=Limnohabitans sp. TaxID=1907725 RepID=UPI0038B6B380